MKKKNNVLLFSLAVIFGASIVWHEVGRGSQYYIGMTVNEVNLLTGSRYQKQKFGMDYDEPLTSQQMNDDEFYYIYDEREGILLTFNYNEKLINKKRIKILGVNCFKLLDSIRLQVKRL